MARSKNRWLLLLLHSLPHGLAITAVKSSNSVGERVAIMQLQEFVEHSIVQIVRAVRPYGAQNYLADSSAIINPLLDAGERARLIVESEQAPTEGI